MSNAIEAFNQLHKELDKDYIICAHDYMSDMNSQTRRRNVVRSLFAHVEGTAYQLKQLVKFQFEKRIIDLPIIEIAAIDESVFQVEKNGDVKGKKQGIPTLNNIRFSFKLFSKAFALDWSPDFGEQGWNDFVKALEIRDRITHPKTFEDVTISNPDMNNITNAQGWWRNTLNVLFFKLSERG